MSSYSNDLLSWLSLFWTESSAITYDKLLDGYFLNEVFQEIDPNASKNDELTETNKEGIEFVKNWEILINNIKIYYTEVLQQTLLVRLPSILIIYHEKTSDKSIQEINKAIFLILGAAVQCERKEYFIQDIITRLSDESIQHGLMGFIKQITEETETVISYINLDQMSQDLVVQKLCKISTEWENSFIHDTRSAIERFIDLLQKVSSQQNQIRILKNVGNLDNVPLTGSTQSDKMMVLELAETKARVRKLQNELDDKNDALQEMRDDLEAQTEECSKLREAQIKLNNEARRVRTLQDELDSQREAISRTEQIEKDNLRLKEKVNELEYYKVRCEELREDLAVLSAENQNLVDKMENEKIQDKLASLQYEYEKLMKKFDEQNKILIEKQEEIVSLQDEIFDLHEKDTMNLSNKSELEKKLAEFEGNQDVDRDLTKQNRRKSISNQIMEKNADEIIKLKSEIRQLKAELNMTNQSGDLNRLQERNGTLTQEMGELKNKISRLQESNKKEIEHVMLEKEKTQLVIREKKQLEMKIEMLQENDKRREEEVQIEIDSLNDTILTLRERSEKSTESRMKDLEQENTKLHGSINESNQKLSKLEFDMKRQIQKATRLEASLEKAHQDYLVLSKQNEQLNKELAALKYLKTNLEDLQKKYSNLENEKLHYESLVSEYSLQLKQNQTKDDKKIEENLKEIMMQNQQKLQQLTSRLKEKEEELLKIKTEKDKLEREYSMSQKKFKLTMDELEGCRNEIMSLNKLEAKLKQTEKTNGELLKERDEIQGQNLKLEEELKKCQRDYRKLKTQIDIQQTSIDKYRKQLNDYEVKFQKLQQEKVLQEDTDYLKNCLNDSEQRLMDLEQKNRELYQQAIEEKRKCEILREQLLTERLEKQKIRSEMDKWRDELGQIGADIGNDSSNIKFDKLEEKFNNTVKETMKKKDERIEALNIKLSTSQDRNKELNTKIEELNNQYQSLQQKYEEELAVNAIKQKKSAASSAASTNSNLTSYASYLTELKDRLIVLERQNAELTTEKNHLHLKCDELMKEKSASSEKMMKYEEKFNKELANSMKYQIETTTLQSQLETQREENGNLSKQLRELDRQFYTVQLEIGKLKETNELLEEQSDSLKRINDKLSVDYENMKLELNQHKIMMKDQQINLMSAEKELVNLRKDAENVKQLKEILENEKGTFQDSARYLITIRQENKTLSSENHDLVKEKARLESNLTKLTQEYKFLKSEKNRGNDSCDKLLVKNQELEKAKKDLEKEIIKLEEKIDSLSSENERLYDENQKLLQQMKSMLTQNHELLSETLQNRADHYSEETALKERLNQLQRQKERLEEKIMEQYKYINPTKKPKVGRNFFKKARDLLKRRDSKLNLNDDSRKSPVEPQLKAQRSKSCTTMLGNGSTTWFDTEDRCTPLDQYNSDSDDMISSERSVPLNSNPRPSDYNATNQAISFDNSDNNSLYSSLAITNATPTKLLPGSMSIYDRDNKERQRADEMTNWLNKSVIEQTAYATNNNDNKSQPIISRHSVNLTNRTSLSNNSANTITSANSTLLSNSNQGSGKSTGSTSTKYINNRVRPNSVLEKPKRYESPTSPSASGAMTTAARTVVKDSSSSQHPIKFANITSHTTASPQSPPSSSSSQQPEAPLRKSSLPFTDRSESEIHPSISQPQQRKSLTNHNTQPVPPRSSSTVPSRSSSTVPSTASSKEILRRLKSSSSNAYHPQPIRNRPATPNSELQQSKSKTTSTTTPIRPYTVMGQQIPPPPIRRESNSSSIAPRKTLPAPPSHRPPPPNVTPTPPSHKTTPTPPQHRNSSCDNSSSTKSDISDHVVVGRKQKPQKIYYEYGNV